MPACILYKTADCEEEEVRLQDGTDRSNGRVEVCHSGIWSSLCSDKWNLSDASVLCKQLEFESEGLYFVPPPILMALLYVYIWAIMCVTATF